MTIPSRDDQFRAFVLEARVGLVHTATLLTAGDRHLAEDLVQTALTRLYVVWPRVCKSDAPHAYVRRIMVNALIDERRRPFWRRETTHAEVPELPDASAVESDEGSMQHNVEAALAALPPGMRAAVVFRHVHELSVAETADALGCSQGNVKSQTARGLDRLRDALTNDLTTANTRSNP